MISRSEGSVAHKPTTPKHDSIYASAADTGFNRDNFWVRRRVGKVQG